MPTISSQRSMPVAPYPKVNKKAPAHGLAVGYHVACATCRLRGEELTAALKELKELHAEAAAARDALLRSRAHLTPMAAGGGSEEKEVVELMLNGDGRGGTQGSSKCQECGADGYDAHEAWKTVGELRWAVKRVQSEVMPLLKEAQGHEKGAEVGLTPSTKKRARSEDPGQEDDHPRKRAKSPVRLQIYGVANYTLPFIDLLDATDTNKHPEGAIGSAAWRAAAIADSNSKYATTQPNSYELIEQHGELPGFPSMPAGLGAGLPVFLAAPEDAACADADAEDEYFSRPYDPLQADKPVWHGGWPKHVRETFKWRPQPQVGIDVDGRFCFDWPSEPQGGLERAGGDHLTTKTKLLLHKFCFESRVNPSAPAPVQRRAPRSFKRQRRPRMQRIPPGVHEALEQWHEKYGRSWRDVRRAYLTFPGWILQCGAPCAWEDGNPVWTNAEQREIIEWDEERRRWRHQVLDNYAWVDLEDLEEGPSDEEWDARCYNGTTPPMRIPTDGGDEVPPNKPLTARELAYPEGLDPACRWWGQGRKGQFLGQGPM